MLRNIGVPADHLSFLAGRSEMARLIRDLDWSGNPLGPPETWPQSLRSALSICLHSAFPTAIYWGPDLRLLYNDAWAPVPGPRHPAALGAPAREVWADIWHVIEPQLARLLRTGEGFFVENQLLPMRRYGLPEETYWNYSFTAIRGESGEIAGIFNSGNETTETVLSQRQMKFLLELGDALRSAPDGVAARRVATRMLGQHLNVDRSGFCEIAPDGETITITEEWLSDQMASMGRHAHLPNFGRQLSADALAGRVIRIEDVQNEPRVDEPRAKETFAALDIAASVGVPWIENGRLVAGLFVHSREPRHWTDYDVATSQHVLEWTWSWIERERAAEREKLMAREIDHRAKNALAVVQAVVRLARADSVGEFRDQIGARISSLARTHGLLSAGRWTTIDFADLVAEELSPFLDAEESRVAVDGPPLPLPPDLAQTVALVVHELATNAVKHGALSAPDGQLRVSWRLSGAGALQLEWDEERADGGSPPAQQQVGFGTSLLRKTVEQQLKGAIEQSWERGGMGYRLMIPLQALGQTTGAGAGRGVESSSAQARQGGPARVMIAEDEPIIAMDIEARVEALGYRIFGVFDTAAAALAGTAEQLPDLALLDANLRGESSVPVAEALHDRGVPVVFVTGYDAILELPERLAAVPLLSKPISDESLRDALAAAAAAGSAGS